MAQIENLKKVAKFGVDLTNQVIVANEGGWKFQEILGFIDELSQIPGIIQAGPELLAEVKALDDAAATELNTYIKGVFDIPDDKLEGVIEDSLSLVTSLIALVNKLRPAAVVEPTA